MGGVAGKPRLPLVSRRFLWVMLEKIQRNALPASNTRLAANSPNMQRLLAAYFHHANHVLANFPRHEEIPIRLHNPKLIDVQS
jgi:hypothetical protein